MKITTVGIDLAKAVFQVHGVDERGKTALKKQLGVTQQSTFVVFKAGKEVGRSTGQTQKQAIADLFDKAL